MNVCLPSGRLNVGSHERFEDIACPIEKGRQRNKKETSSHIFPTYTCEFAENSDVLGEYRLLDNS